MRIAIDCSAVPRQMAGAGVYTYQLVRALTEADTEHELIVFCRSGLFADLTASHPRLRLVHTDAGSRMARFAWEQAVLPLLLRRSGADVLHSPHHHTPLAAGLPRVVTFHDLTFLLLPGRYPIARRFYMRGVTRASARVADAIIAPSETVRGDIMRALGLPAERVIAIPEAAAPQYAPVEDMEALDRTRRRYGLPNRYILSVGSLEPGKNRGRLILAYDSLKLGADCPLIIAGQPAWQYDGELDLIRQLALEQTVRFLGYVPDEDMPALYSGATMLAFPSLYEGFGLPVLEAMACGTPVITATGSAPAEIADGAALLIDPRDVEALAGALRRLLSDEPLRADLRTRGLDLAARYSWAETARKTLAVYESVAAR